MASFNECINIAIQDKKITKKVGEEILESDDPAAMIASMAATTTRKKREAAIDAIRTGQRMEEMAAHPNGAYYGLSAQLGRDIKGVAGTANIDFQSRVYTNYYNSMWAEALSAFRTRTFGFTQDKKALGEFAGAVYGVPSKNAEINKFAKQWLELNEAMRTKFNSLGGNIYKNDNYLFPQNHDIRRITKATEDGWVDYVKPLMDRSKMVNDLGKVLDDAEFDATIRYVYQTIKTGGMNKAQGLKVPRGSGSKLSRQGSEKRVLYFKDADSWMGYQDKFGKGDMFSTLTDHIQNRSHDIAMIESFGTNPRNMFEGLKYQAKRLQQKRGNPITESESFLLEAKYKNASGEINGGELTTIADGGSAVRNVMVGAYYPAALLASFTDMATVSLTASYNGMSASRVLARIASTGGEQERMFAAKIGIISQSWLGRQHSTNRIADTFGVGVDAKISEGVMRASGLEEWTNRTRKAFGMESSANIADNFKFSYDKLPADMKKQFKSYGITADDWNAFRSTQAMTFDGVKFADFTKDKSMKFHAMVLTETDFAVPTPGVTERAVLTAGTKRGSIEGQVIRQAAFAKSHPVTVMMTHWNRMMQQDGLSGKVAYGGTFALATTAMGALAIHAKDIAKGKEPQDMNGEFWKKAFLMGGSGGLLADYAMVDPGDYGNSPIETLIGPGAQFFNRTFDLTLGNLHEAIKGEEMNVLGDIAKYTKYITPGVWETDLFFNSMMDQAILSVDPNYQKTISKIRRSEMKDYSRGFWFGPGETVGDLFD